MGKYIFKRILAMVPVVLLITFAVFILNILAQTVKTAKQKRPGLNRTLTVNLLKALFP